LFDFLQTLAIARQHFEICECPVGQQYRLRSLQVRVTGNDHVTMRLSKIEQ
jgi:hypothetical protein